MMTTGSPALAAYSLVLSALNVRSVRRRVKATNYENWEFLTEFLIYTQQTPLELIKAEHPLELIEAEHPLEVKGERPLKVKGKRPLEVKCEDLYLSISDKEWRESTTKLVNERSNHWTLAAGLSVAWVIIAFVVTLADSFAYLAAMGSQGHAVGTIWLWLLCLVIGWLWVPTFSGNQLQSAFHKTGEAAKREIKKRREAAEKQREANEKEQSTETPVEEICQEPRLPLRQSTASTAYAPQYVPRSEILVAKQYRQSTASTAYVPGSGRLVVKEKVIPLTRDEHRFSATFNYSRVMRYLTFVYGILETLEISHEVGLLSKRLMAVVSLILNRRGS